MAVQARPTTSGAATAGGLSADPVSEVDWHSDLTPAELVHWARLSPTEQFVAFLRRLECRRPGRLRLQQIGSSAAGSPILAAHVLPSPGADSLPRPVALLFAQQHGDEPAGKEACLALVRDLVLDRVGSLADRLDIWVVPQLNPDGAASGSRRNARRVDLNRGHQILAAPEQRALYSLYHRVRPHLTIDLHEYDVESNALAGGEIVAAYDVMADGPTNPNVGRALRDLARQGLDALGSACAARGFSFRRYVRGDPENRDGRGLRYSTLHVFDGRNTPALFGSLAFIVEATRHREPLARLERRVTATGLAVRALLAFCAERAAQVVEAVQIERLPLPDRDVVLRAEYHPAAVDAAFRFDYVRPATGESGSIRPRWASIGVAATRMRPLPVAYWIDGDLNRRMRARLMRALAGHHVVRTRLGAPLRARVETYTIEAIAAPDPRDSRSSVVVSSRVSRQTIPRGATLIYTDQPGGRLASLVLEPESMDGLLASGVWEIPAGGLYPVRRVLRVRRTRPKG